MSEIPNKSMAGLPLRIQRSRTRGWKMPENTVCVTRGTRWGNPFRIGGHYDVGDDKIHVVKTAEHAIELYRRFSLPLFTDQELQELTGKNLACWCQTDAPCHADDLIKAANTPGHIAHMRTPDQGRLMTPEQFKKIRQTIGFDRLEVASWLHIGFDEVRNYELGYDLATGTPVQIPQHTAFALVGLRAFQDTMDVMHAGPEITASDIIESLKKQAIRDHEIEPRSETFLRVRIEGDFDLVSVANDLTMGYPAHVLLELSVIWLRTRHPDSIIVPEFSTSEWGGGSIDVVAITKDKIIGIEIKGDGDSTTRLKLQEIKYPMVAQEMWLIAAPSLEAAARKHRPCGWGRLTISEGQATIAVEAGDVRARNNAYSMISCLWSDEVISMARHFSKPVFKGNKEANIQSISEFVPLAAVRRQFISMMIDRDWKRFGKTHWKPEPPAGQEQ